VTFEKLEIEKEYKRKMTKKINEEKENLKKACNEKRAENVMGV